MDNQKIEADSNGFLNRTPVLQYVLVTLLFPLWGAAASLNDVLIAQFKTYLLNFPATFAAIPYTQKFGAGF